MYILFAALDVQVAVLDIFYLMHHVGVLLIGEENVSFHLAHVLPSQLSFFANIICKHWMPQMIKPVVNTPLQMIPNLQNC